MEEGEDEDEEEGKEEHEESNEVQAQVEHLEVKLNPEDVVNAGLEGEVVGAWTRAVEKGARAELLQCELEHPRRENAELLVA